MEKLKVQDFQLRHIGPSETETKEILKFLNLKSLEELVDKTIPSKIRLKNNLALENSVSEIEILEELKGISLKNKVYRSYLGMGYSDCFTPHVILRNVLENPGWYTQYTPYQAEISQGRLEALLNFQTLIADLTGLPIANASLLDEGTAAAEAMAMTFALQGRDQSKKFFVSKYCHPQTIEVVQTRAEPLGISVVVGEPQEAQKDFASYFAVLIQYPDTLGRVENISNLISAAKAAKINTILACDLLALSILKSPGEIGADIAIGSAQRFGVPMGFGGPHAAFMSTKDEFKRQMPGRIIGLSKDLTGKPAARLALQTREQHIRRDKATSNICTAQVLLAVMASMFAVYHGPEGIKEIGQSLHAKARSLAGVLEKLGYKLLSKSFFDTIAVELTQKQWSSVHSLAEKFKINLRAIPNGANFTVVIALDETTALPDLEALVKVFNEGAMIPHSSIKMGDYGFANDLERKSSYLTHPNFNRYHSEHEMLRYMNRLQSMDLSLTTSMIPLGSCTMKLNATTEMIPVTWKEFSGIHPFAPREQTLGYMELFEKLEKQLAVITGFDAVSLQPNAGSQGEYSGLLVIRKFQKARGQGHRNVCLIPISAHGTNPASAAMAGMKVVVVACDANGNIDLPDLRAKTKEHEKDLAAIMMTYPSTHGVFEESVQEVCELIHQAGGQVYMDGANMNAQVGLTAPGFIGADVCHLNLHKTFCIPHGGGGPGVGPIGVKKHLAEFLPGSHVGGLGGNQSIGAISSAPWGSASILPISYSYIRMMGADGLKRATQVAILNANYIAKKLDPHYPVLYKGTNGFVAHECIVDCRQLKATSGVEVEDIAKRLMDYGFHAPTISFPVSGTMMIEPTESESKAELDRFCDALISIRGEIAEIEKGKADPKNNVLKNAPHTAEIVTATEWARPYSREMAAYPVKSLREYKFWPAVSRIDNVYGDRNLFCTCGPIAD